MAVKKLKLGQPDRYLRRPMDMTPLRLGHMNALVDRINEAIAEASDVTALQAEITALKARVLALENPG